jgi:pyruvate dehydrogenase E2 component (dihydrolipoamide acetyltransferase)
MKQEIRLPEIADNVVSGFLSRILVKVGDVIEKDQSIIEMETDKAATDIPSPIGGKIVDIKVNAGDEVRVGQVIMVLEVLAESGVVSQEVPAFARMTEKEFVVRPHADFSAFARMTEGLMKLKG